MKKIVKITSMLAMAGVILLSSGCSCSVKKDKVNENSKALFDREFDLVKDFTADYKNTQTQEQEDGTVVISEYSYKIVRNSKNDEYQLFTTIKTGKKGEDLLTLTSEEAKIYKENNIVYVKQGDGVAKNTDYQSTMYALLDTAKLVEENLIAHDYYGIVMVSYNNYKITPFHACAESGDKTKVPEVLASTINAEMTCKASKKIFGKNLSYKVHYRVSISELRDVTIKTDKDNNLFEVIQEGKIANGLANALEEVIVLKIS